jgi:large exoprotein involved in heme utilization and adhesion
MADRGAVSTSTSGKGAGGGITLELAQLNLTTGSTVTSSSAGPGNAGSVLANATESISLADSGSGLFSTASNAGNAGSIQVTTPGLTMADSSELSTSTSGSGAGGHIQVQTDQLETSNEATIAAASTGAGNGGDIEITNTGLFTMNNSSVTTAADNAQGGNITIVSGNIRLDNNALISSQSSGAGNAGNIDVTSSDSLLMKNSSITTEAKHADGGNIGVHVPYMVTLDNSTITASVGGGPRTTGGNINIDPQYVILKNGRIVANAYEGKGGNISIKTETFLADPESVVDASSSLGISGTVNIQAAVTNVNGLLSPLSTNFTSASELLREPCMARLKGGKYSSFIISGRDGLPIEPGSPMPSHMP